ncbi:hypothetical protein LTR78_001072 [Recurvomyces mirabilis]|uniref:Uncharacterized protein n=1 Tax=Recurvomyces mirabilis TaxID=574656 RepID=A0AAE1C653_9PEZI|nr:hypothetical protein LTR78_001072 [Recurvomyces mirabilis]KAK5159044.1 hypothetical protein LTS14_003152 [Recurvomyces mirabilis]
MADHPDFQSLPWARKLLLDADVRITVDIPKKSEGNMAPNRMFVKLLYRPGAINAHAKFWRPNNEPDALHHKEECYLLSLGPLIDGASGRAHGGFNGMVRKGWRIEFGVTQQRAEERRASISGIFRRATATTQGSEYDIGHGGIAQGRSGTIRESKRRGIPQLSNGKCRLSYQTFDPADQRRLQGSAYIGIAPRRNSCSLG